MKFKELSNYLLIEGLKDVKRQFVDSNKVTEEVFNKAVSMDPSDTKKYVAWILKMYLNDHREFSRLKTLIPEYYELSNKKRIRGVDHNSFKKIEDMVDAINKAEKPSKADLKRGVKSSDDYKSEDIIFENDKVLVLFPKCTADSIKYGRGGKVIPTWCTSAMGNRNYFDFYFENGYNIYILIPKVDLSKFGDALTKIAISVEPETDKFAEVQNTSNKFIKNWKEILDYLGVPWDESNG